jgi:TPR repeat protein
MEAKMAIAATTTSVTGRSTVINVDGFAGSLRVVPWLNHGILLSTFSMLMGVTLVFATSYDPHVRVAGLIWLAVIAFPAWIAWHNIDVVSALSRRFTIRSLLVIVVYCLFQLILIVWREVVNLRSATFPAASFTTFTIGLLLGPIAAYGVWRARKQVIDTLGLSVADLLRDLKEHRMPGPSGALVINNQMRGVAWLAFGVLVMLVTTQILLMFGEQFYILLIEYGLLMCGGFALLKGRAVLQPTAFRVLAQDHRAPVLLLRSFVGDERVAFARAESLLVDLSLFDPSLESRLARYFSEYGPFIAVRSPRDESAIIGAARARLSESEWQAQVINWIDQANTIVVMAGASDGVGWELRQVLERGAANRLIVAFPPINRPRVSFRDSMVQRHERLKSCFSGTRWETELARVTKPESLRALVFNADGSLTAIRGTSRNRNNYHFAVLFAHWLTLRNNGVLQKGPLPAAARRRSVSDWAGSGLAGTIGAVCLVYGAVSGGGMLIPIGLGAAALATINIPFLRGIRRNVDWGWRIGTIISSALVLHGVLVWMFLGSGELLFQKGSELWDTMAVALFKYAAYSGVDEAKYNLGIAFINGQGVSRDVAAGCRWLTGPAKAGLTQAETQLGRCLMAGAVPGKPAGDAVGWLEKAAAKGDQQAMANLGDMLYFGNGVARDARRAIPYYEVLSSQGNTVASLLLGRIYLFGDGTPVAQARARGYLDKAAKADNPDALYLLGLMSEKGWDGTRDPVGAVELYQRAAAKDHHAAQLNLGALLYSGMGVTQDLARARSLFVAALASDDPKIRDTAQANLRLVDAPQGIDRSTSKPSVPDLNRGRR